MTPDSAFTALQEANPAPVRPIDDRPSAREMLAVAELAGEATVPQVARRPVLAASIAFAVAILLVGAVALVALTSTGSLDPSSTSVPTPTDSTVPSTTTLPQPTTTVTSSAMSPESVAVLGEFAARYSEGDVDGVLGMLAPGVVKTTVRDADPEHIWGEDELRFQLVMDAVLGTTLEFVSCEPLQSGSVSCLARRQNDLTRIAGAGPQDDLVTLRVEAGLITVWQDRQGFHATDYQQLAVAPFTAWLADAHPEIADPHPLVGGVSLWRIDRSIVDVAPALVAEYAESRGIDLQG